MNYGLIKHIIDEKGYKVLKIRTGMMLEVQENIGEGNTRRIWKFRGLVTKVKNPQHHDGTFTLRGETSGVKIEKIYPLSYTKFEKVDLLDLYKIRRAKLYYFKHKVGKDAKFKSIAAREQKNSSLLTS